MYSTLVAAGFPSSKWDADRHLARRLGWATRPTALNTSPTTTAAYVAAYKIDQRPFRGDWCNRNNAGHRRAAAGQPRLDVLPILSLRVDQATG